MSRNPDDADCPRTMADATKRARRPHPRSLARPAAQRAGTNLLSSFGMIAGLLLGWAIIVSM
jgi:hypothetical protein